MIETLLYLSKYKLCPTCGASVISVVKDANQVAKDGTCYEHVKFECGCAIRYIPVQKVIRTTPCPEDSIVQQIQEQRYPVLRELVALVEKYQEKVDTSFLDSVLKNAKNKAMKCIENQHGIPKTERRISN